MRWVGRFRDWWHAPVYDRLEGIKRQLYAIEHDTAHDLANLAWKVECLEYPVRRREE